MLRRSRQFHLVHGMLLAEELPALATVNAAIRGIQAFSARRLQTDIIQSANLPVILRNDVFGVQYSRRLVVARLGPGGPTCTNGRVMVLVRFKNVQPF